MSRGVHRAAEGVVPCQGCMPSGVVFPERRGTGHHHGPIGPRSGRYTRGSGSPPGAGCATRAGHGIPPAGATSAQHQRTRPFLADEPSSASRNPTTSVLYPVVRPSRMAMVFTAPTAAASGSTASSRASRSACRGW